MAESEGSNVRRRQRASGVMRVVLSFDIEIWCGGWEQLDQKFPAAFERYIYGRSEAGAYALPKTLEILQRHQLQAVFFIEPLFAARFGLKYLEEVVGLIKAAGQDVQLHLHPEWSDEITPLPFPGAAVKRQHLFQYDLEEQTRLIGLGKQLLQQAGGGQAQVFRAGSYAANANTYKALAANGIYLDSSLNNCFANSGQDIPRDNTSNATLDIGEVHCVPVSVYQDGLGCRRPAQISAAGNDELKEAMESALAQGQTDFVVVSHNFEMLKAKTSLPDRLVVNRFENLCAFLAAQAHRFDVGPFRSAHSPSLVQAAFPQVSRLATTRRYIEQLRRRF